MPYLGDQYGVIYPGSKICGRMPVEEFLRSVKHLNTDQRDFLIREARRPRTIAPEGTSKDQGERYAAGHLKKYVDELSKMPGGDRNNRLAKRAFHLGTMVPRDWIERETIEQDLRDAVAHWDDQPKTLGTLTRCLEDGMKKPHDDLRGYAAIDPNDFRPIIDLAVGETERIVDEIEAALIKAKRGLYRRGGRVVCVGYSTMPTHDERDIEVQAIEERGDAALLEDMEAAAIFKSAKGKRTSPPSRIALTFKQRTHRLRLPPLNGVINSPLMRANGDILDAPGYDAKTGLLFDPRGVEFPSVPDRPTKAEAKAALDRIGELIKTFTFIGAEDRAVALSLIITAVVRRSLDFAPLHALDSPVAGSGKSMIVDIASIIATGHEAGVVSQGKTAEEFEKRLGALLMRGDAIISIDNCEVPLEGDVLCSALTQKQLAIRILGRSEMPVVQTNMFFTATGNNLIVKGDVTRRALVGRLDPKVERPELLEFSYDPIAVARANRAKLVRAVLTMLRAFVVAGRPERPPPLANFETWSRLVRGGLLWLGETDPVKTMERTREKDPILRDLRLVMSQWRDIIGNEMVTTSDLAKKAEEAHWVGQYDDKREYRHPDFRDALVAVAGKGGRIEGRLLGHWLARQQERVVVLAGEPAEAFKFERCGERRGFALWRVVEAKV
jgi:putative DNA primase/helicase